MTAFSKQHLLSELTDRTELIMSNAKSFRRLNNVQFNFRPVNGQWSIAEIFEHLNITHRIYINSILPKISNAPEVKSVDYRSSWIGDFVYEQMMPRADGTVLKLKARKLLQPVTNELDGHDVLDRFLQCQDAIHDVLQHAATKDLRRIKIPFSFTGIIRLRLGDNLRFLIAHNERHILQAQKIAAKITMQDII